MIYLASPYSHDDPQVRLERYREACRAAAWLMDHRSDVVFSPIAMTHGMAEFRSLATSWEHWRTNYLGFLRKCDALFVLAIDGWETSPDVQEEIRMALIYCMEVKMLTPYDNGYAYFCGDYRGRDD
jgi:hypothetical protein